MIDIATITLQSGAHNTPDDGMCLLEAAAYIAGEPFTDHPQCVCPVLAAFGRSWNDTLDNKARNRILLPFLPRLIGTRATANIEQARAFLATDWLVRTFTPAWLRLAGLDDHANNLAALPELASADACVVAQPTINAARADAGAAARDAGAAARDAGAAARDAGAAARDAWAAARDAGAAARDAARDAGAAARDAGAAGDVAWDTWAAARDAGAAARAARDAAGDALHPTTIMLQASAADLFDRMIRVA